MGLPTWNQSEFVVLALTLSIRNLGECENKNVDLVELKRDVEIEEQQQHPPMFFLLSTTG
jgi:hypothetical protein